MSDIVERLREGCGCNFPETTCMAESECADAFEAADEITRLRAALSTARADALEEAARAVAAMPRTYDKVREDVDVLGIGKGTWTLTLNNGPKECADVIRALATTPKE